MPGLWSGENRQRNLEERATGRDALIRLVVAWIFAVIAGIAAHSAVAGLILGVALSAAVLFAQAVYKAGAR
jgi:hypothetical protein